MNNTARKTDTLVEGKFNSQGSVTQHQDRENQLASEINLITAQTKQMVLLNSIEIGRRLCEAKSLVKKGTWGAWLQEKVSYSQRSANNFMKIYQEYGKQIHPVSDSQALANLSYTQALALISLPPERREQFAIAHNASSLSSRKLQEEVREECARIKSSTPEQIAEEDTQIASAITAKQADLAAIEKQLSSLSGTVNRLEERLDRNLGSGMKKAVESALQDAKNQQATVSVRRDALKAEIDRLNSLKIERIKALMESETPDEVDNSEYAHQISKANARTTCSVESLFIAYKKASKEIQALADLDRVAAMQLFDKVTDELTALQEKMNRTLRN